MRRLADLAETSFVRALLTLFAVLPPVAASNLGGWMMRQIGRFLPSHQYALTNIAMALPERDPADRQRIALAAWENLGRVLAELVHLPRILEPTAHGPGIELIGEEIIPLAIQAAPPTILFSAHLSNWELMLPLGNRLAGPIAGIFRAPQRQGVTNLLTQARFKAAGGPFPLFAKGAKGGRDAFAYMRAGGNLAMLMDQKLNDGIAVPFFGRLAMTADALAKFALRYRAVVVPAHIERLAPARYRVIIHDPVPLPDSGNYQQDILALTTQVNAIMEGWIRARPEEWLWMHRRWPKEIYRRKQG